MTTPDGRWRCTNCGDLLPPLSDEVAADDEPAVWAWSGSYWKHRCEGFGPHFGWMRAERLSPEAVGAPPGPEALDSPED